jgi:ADP-ribose pyrophosphatase YjhB (NUDIX family)
MTIDPAIEQQLAELARRYKLPRRATVELSDGAFSPFTKGDRFGEVCMLVRRKNGRLLTARKEYYPPGIHRLLTGGVAHGERIEDALLREVHEETGLQVAVDRFLLVIAYHVQPTPAQLDAGEPDAGAICFYTFAFLLNETGGDLQPQDEEEQIEEFREVTTDDLPALAAALKQLPDRHDPQIAGSWKPWGDFRAVVHQLAYAALKR